MGYLSETLIQDWDGDPTRAGATMRLTSAQTLTLSQDKNINGDGIIYVPANANLLVHGDVVRLHGPLALPGRNVWICARVLELEADDAGHFAAISTAGSDVPATLFPPLSPPRRGDAGSPGRAERCEPIPASDTQDYPGGTGGDGSAGENGINGERGQDGGAITLLCQQIVSKVPGTALQLTSRGGAGGAAQHGSDGGDGGHGGDGSDRIDKVGFLYLGHFEPTAGGNGGNGGHGGNGGRGGDGGHGGVIQVYLASQNDLVVTMEAAGGAGGLHGNAGKGGQAGPGGRGGRGVYFNVGGSDGFHQPTEYDQRPGGYSGSMGADGQSGADGLPGADASATLHPALPATYLGPWVSPYQLQMLLDQAATIYVSALPGHMQQDQINQLTTWLRWIMASGDPWYWQASACNGLADALVNAYAKQLSQIGADAQQVYAPLRRTAASLLRQIGNGHDYFGLTPDYAPRGSVSLYQQTLNELLPRLRTLDNTWQTLAQQQQQAGELRATLRQGVATALSHAAYLEGEASMLAVQTNQLADWIAREQHNVDAAKDRLLLQAEQFRIAIETANGFRLEDLCSVLESLSFTSEESLRSTAMLAAQSGKLLKLARDSTETLTGTDGVRYEKAYMVSRLDIWDQDITSINQAIDVKNGTLHVDDEGLYQIVALANKLDYFVEPLIKVEGAAALRNGAHAYIRAIQARNAYVRQYNAAVTRYTTLLSDAHRTRSEGQELERQLAQQVLEAGASRYLSHLASTRRNLRYECLHLLTLLDRAWQFWAMHNSPAPFDQPATITADSIAQIAANIVRNITTEDERRGQNASTFPAPNGLGTLLVLTPDSHPDVLAQLRSTGRSSFELAVPAPTASRAENPFAGWWDVRLSSVRPWLLGAASSDGYVAVSITHSGREAQPLPEGRFERTHNPVTLEFKYRNDATLLNAVFIDHNFERQGDLGQLIENDAVLNDHTNGGLFAPVGPFTRWIVNVHAERNAGLDLTQLSALVLQFAGSYYPDQERVALAA